MGLYSLLSPNVCSGSEFQGQCPCIARVGKPPMQVRFSSGACSLALSGTGSMGPHGRQQSLACTTVESNPGFSFLLTPHSGVSARPTRHTEAIFQAKVPGAVQSGKRHKKAAATPVAPGAVSGVVQPAKKRKTGAAMPKAPLAASTPAPSASRRATRAAAQSQSVVVAQPAPSRRPRPAYTAAGAVSQ